jgi:CAAX protease family protein
MKTYQRLLIFGLLVLALTALLSPWAAAAWAHFINTHLGWENYQYTFAKIFDRVFMIMGIVMFFVCRRFLKLGSLNELGLSPRTHAVRDVSLGAAFSLASMLALACLMSFTDVFDPFFRLSAAETLERCAKALLAAVSVAFIEEIFFRGIVFKGLRQDMRAVFAYLLAALFFSAIHFVQPANEGFLSGMHPGAGFRHAVESFYPFLNPETLLPGIFGLFLIGLVLCYAFERTGTLYMSMGLHAGWIFGLKSFGAFGHYTRESLGWMFGSSDPKVVSGVISWVGIVVVGLWVHWFTRARSRLNVKTLAH